jgi:tRNA(Ile)-lysidine synthase
LLRGDSLASEAFDQARIEALFAPLTCAKGLLLAVSGGPDSTALMIMAAQWARKPGRPKIGIATIDHALRAGSRAEAEAVGEHARRRGFEHHLIQWPGEKPASRIQERAREARYRLLRACALEIGADHIVTAHHADDQSETILFRLLRGSSVAGLRGMETFATRDGVALARPLLGLRKSALIAYCQSHGETFADDPANSDPRFARTRLRRLTTLLAEQGFGPSEAARLSRRAARIEEVVRLATEAAATRLNWTARGAIRDAKALFDEPQEIALRLLCAEIAEVGGSEAGRVRLEQIEALGEALRRSAARGEAFRATLGGASLHLNEKGVLRIEPEPPRRKKVEACRTKAGAS